MPNETLQRFQAELDCLGSRFKLLSVLGQGSYGAVLKAEDVATNATYAIKRVHPRILLERDLSVRILREVLLLRHFDHSNILYLTHYLCNKDIVDLTEQKEEVQQLTNQSQASLYLVTPLMDTDLRQLLNSQQELKHEHVSYLMFQLLCGLRCIHGSGVAHRDITPGNILVNTLHCDLKIADLGLAREVDEEHRRKGNMTEYVTVRWYRSPEVLCSSRSYGVSVDIWAAACIFAELLGAQPLFQGTHTSNQLIKIINVVGSPSADVVKKMGGSADTRDYILRLRQTKGTLENTIAKFSLRDTHSVDLFRSMLQFNPAKRVTAEEALQHKYFAEFEEDLPRFTQFTFEPAEYKTSMDVRRRLVNLTSELKRVNRKACVSAAASAGVVLLVMSVYSRLLVCDYPIRISLSFDPSHRTVSVTKQGAVLMPRFALADPPDVKINVGLHPNARWKQVGTAISNFLTLEVNSVRHKAQHTIGSAESAVRPRHSRVSSMLPSATTPRPGTPGRKSFAAATHAYSKVCGDLVVVYCKVVRTGAFVLLKKTTTLPRQNKRMWKFKYKKKSPKNKQSMPDFFAMGVQEGDDHDKVEHGSSQASLLASFNRRNPLAVFTPRGKNVVKREDDNNSPGNTPTNKAHTRTLSGIQYGGKDAYATPRAAASPSHDTPRDAVTLPRPFASTFGKSSPEQNHLQLNLSGLHAPPQVNPHWNQNKLRQLDEDVRPARLMRDLKSVQDESLYADIIEVDDTEGSDHGSVHDHGSEAGVDDGIMLDMPPATTPPPAPTRGRAQAAMRRHPFSPKTPRDPSGLIAGLLAPHRPPYTAKRLQALTAPVTFLDTKTGDTVSLGVAASGRCLIYRVSENSEPHRDCFGYVPRPRYYHVGEILYEMAENRLVFPGLRKTVHLPPLQDLPVALHPLTTVVHCVWAVGIPSNFFGNVLTRMPATKSTVVCSSDVHYDPYSCEVPSKKKARPTHGRTHSHTMFGRSGPIIGHHSPKPHNERRHVKTDSFNQINLEAKFDASLNEDNYNAESTHPLSMTAETTVLQSVQRAFPAGTIDSDYNFMGSVRCFISSMDVPTFSHRGVGVVHSRTHSTGNTPRSPRVAVTPRSARGTTATATPRSPGGGGLTASFGMRRSGEGFNAGEGEGETSTAGSSIDFEADRVPLPVHPTTPNGKNGGGRPPAGRGVASAKEVNGGAGRGGGRGAGPVSAPPSNNSLNNTQNGQTAKASYISTVINRSQALPPNGQNGQNVQNAPNGTTHHIPHPAPGRGKPKPSTNEPFHDAKLKRKRPRTTEPSECPEDETEDEEEEEEEEEKAKCGCECILA